MDTIEMDTIEMDTLNIENTHQKQTINESMNEQNKNKFTCQFCKKVLSSRSSFYRHRKHYSKHSSSKNIKNNSNFNVKYPGKIPTIINNNITINPYGNEDLTWLEENFSKLLDESDGIRSLDEFIKFGFKHMHCNPARIQNNNISVKNKKNYFEHNLISVYRNIGIGQSYPIINDC